MNAWSALDSVIVNELIATTALKSNDSSTRLVRSIITKIGSGMALIDARGEGPYLLFKSAKH